MTVSEWVRRVLGSAARDRPARDSARKLAAVRAAATHSYPTADFETMLAEIEAGYATCRCWWTPTSRCTQVVDEVLPFTLTEAHLAVMRTNGVERSLSFDRDFDRYPGVQRLS